MAKKRKSTGEAEAVLAEAEKSTSGSTNGFSFLSAGATIDPGLASLFDKSAGPVQAPQYTAEKLSVTRSRMAGNKDKKDDDQDDDEELSSITEVEGDDKDEEMVDADEDEDEDESDEEEQNANAAQEESLAVTTKEQSRKRKRGDRGDDLEQAYMRRIEKEEAREQKKKDEDAKRRKVAKPTDESDEDEDEDEASESEATSESGSDSDEGAAESSDEEEDVPPEHESVAKTADLAELERSARTVFLGNVSSEAIKSKSAKKVLLAHLGSFFSSLSNTGVTPIIESIRFRSTAFSTAAKPKRAAFAKREIMDSTTRSTNAYVVYNSEAAARKALSLNGSIVLDRHLRVDSVAHPAKMDHKRCVFIGNLGFVDEETAAQDDKDEDGKKKKKKKQKEPADSEEGLWRTFNEHVKIPSSSKDSKSKNKANGTSKSGIVEYVRVVRDRATRVGKGFAYVQFYDENAVEAALLLDGKKFPPLLPRKLRVTRAKRVTAKPTTGPLSNSKARDDKHASMAGRAEKLFGRAGAAKFKKGKMDGAATGANAGALGTRGEGTKIVFEGYRASEGNSKFNVKTKSRGAKARGGKPKTRSARRAKAWKGKKGA